MRAVVIEEHGGPEVLQVKDVPRPQPGPGEVLVRVHASALNRADLLQRRGHYPAPSGAPKDIPGLEFAGEVAECASDVTDWRVGERIFGICGGGGQAEYVAVPAATLARVPARLSWTEAAAVPEVFITAHDALFTQAQVKSDERVLINAVASGVGLAAVQLLRAAGAKSFGTVRSEAKLARAHECGLDAGAAVKSPNELPAKAREWLGGAGGFDVVLELAGGDYVNADIELLLPKGRLMLVGTMAGSQVAVNLGRILGKRLHVIGTALRSRSVEEKAAATQGFVRDVVPLLESGKVKPVIDKVFPLEQVREAHAFMEANSNAGKIVLEIK